MTVTPPSARKDPTPELLSRLRIVAIIACLVALAVSIYRVNRGSDDNANGGTPVRSLSELAENYSLVNLYSSPKPLVAGSTITLEFRDGDMLVRPGCNTISGKATVVDSHLVVASTTGTEMGCEAGLMAQDEWVTAFLAAKPTLERSGPYLSLTGSTASMTLVDATWEGTTTTSPATNN